MKRKGVRSGEIAYMMESIKCREPFERNNTASRVGLLVMTKW